MAWGGGDRVQMWGTGSEIFLMYEEWASKINGEKKWTDSIWEYFWGSQTPSPNIAFFNKLNLSEHFLEALSGRQKIVAYCRAGREIFMRCAEWKFPGKICLNPIPTRS